MIYWVLSLFYAALSCVVVGIELRRGGKLRADPLGMFMLILTLQCVLPGIVIYALLPISQPGEATGMYVFDRIYNFADATSAYLVWTLTAAFIFFVYAGALTTQKMTTARFGAAANSPDREIKVGIGGLVAMLLLGLAITLLAFHSLGDTFLQRYANLILLRSVAIEVVDQTALASNALALAQAWSWLAIVALFAIADQRGRTVLWYLCLAMLVVFAFFGVSRRALFLPIVFSYLILVMSDGKWRFWKLLALGVVMLPIVAFGKEIFAIISHGGSPEAVEQTYSTLVTAGMRTSTDVGITITESLGTISMVDLPPRLGSDHALSLMQRFPEGMLGMQIEFPERMVRISTAKFADEWTVDIPPGLLGQMWLDFRILGPIVWGLGFGIQVGLLQYAWSRVKQTRQAAAVFFLLVFIVALPLNSGSYDFNFSVDIIAALVILFLVVRLERKSSHASSPA